MAGVSQAAVSRVFSKQGYVSREVDDRIREAALALNYVPDLLARSFVKGESDIYALVLGSLLNPFYPYALEHLTKEIRLRGKEVLLFNSADEAGIDELLPTIIKYRARGVLILTANLSSSIAAALSAKDVPTVFFNRYSAIGTVSSVLCDNAQAGRDVAAEFVRSGYGNIGYIGGAAWTSTNHDRKRGFLEGLEEMNVRPTFALDQEFTHAWGSKAIKLVAENFPETEAIFCGDDAIAMGCIDGMTEPDNALQSRRPAIVGVDDIPMAAWPSYSLSTVRQPLGAMISTALDILEQDKRPAQTHLIRGTLVRRRSY